ncbi:FH1/FH2 domain-containing protein 1 isoform X4 [Cherax quadricarinatus]|uniref:FH1/FH2 domain-containing protein 1 isoform X4 n=1 Tax=Cherax quadricarinatus TaxID=27406 RepID=UPI00387EC7D8
MSFLGGTCRILEFLADCAEHIFVLGIIYQRMMTGFQQFLVWLGSPQHLAQDIKVQQVCSTINEFALEYRTCRERVLQQTQKKANHRERNKTGGKMIVETLAHMKWIVPVNVPINQTRMMMWDRNVDHSALEAGEKVLALEPIHVKIWMASCCDLNMVWGKFSGIRYKTHMRAGKE